ncbi:Flavodoxin/ferredoxin--NADP reductase [Candidatus Profftia lariciata]|uniref:ferredoxin--NADP(+) reductase n=1 Tax=Candidatus Profftia lariciata TaxID=1987921 RepID=UPI001D028D9B|nr:ferredoxin--NADP(+) reductase [Candidatus Profftia lariciata]UDG81267.1 Flavodoxin/ferredoxin--NADP reductase [Candidatus Profftia lariciata]
MTKLVTGIITKVQHWTSNLFSITVQAPINNFIAGQFAKLTLIINGERVQRAYSYVNAPNNNNLEFYIVTILNGKLSPYLHKLQIGDNIQISKESSGFFILDEITTCKNIWMLATGTGLGPYLSILQEGKDLDRFQNIVLVHAVRFLQDLSYLALMQDLKQRYKGKLRIQTVISRENVTQSLYGRLPMLIQNGLLESSVGLTIHSNNSHIMMCGNPQMVRDTKQVLQDTRGMVKHLRRQPGHITSEHYW